MHHLASHSLKVRISQVFLFQKGQSVPKVARRKVYQSTRIHDTRANIKKMADFLVQENRLLKEEMATMQAKINEMAVAQAQVDELTELVRTLRAAQNQPPPPTPPVRTQAEASGSAIPDWMICSESPTFSAPPRSAPWFPPYCLRTSGTYCSTYNLCSSSSCDTPSSYYNLFSTSDPYRSTK